MWVCTHFWLENGLNQSPWESKAGTAPCWDTVLSPPLASVSPSFSWSPSSGTRSPVHPYPSLPLQAEAGILPGNRTQPLGYLLDCGTRGSGRRAGSWDCPVCQCSVFALSAFWTPAGFFLQMNWIAQSLISQECEKSVFRFHCLYALILHLSWASLASVVMQEHWYESRA